MFSLSKALLAFTLVFAGAAIPVSQLVSHPILPVRAQIVSRSPMAVVRTGLRVDAGCVRICEPRPSPDPTPPVAAAPPPVAPVAAAPAAPRPAPPRVVLGSSQQSYINSDRASAGLGPLSWNSCLAGVAASWASQMARTGVFQHGPGVSQDLGCHLGNRVGENIAWMTGSPNDASANSMFMNSPDHRANILGPYRYVGTAWATANGKSYLVEEFG
jgi:uncharacterized protein YkwD